MSTSDESKPTLTARTFDPHAVFAERLAGRTIIYLDNNIWIDLRDTRTAEARSCRDLCVSLVEAQKAVFPVSYAAVTELLHVPDADDRLRQAELVDQLSGGVTVRSPSFVYAAEAAAGYSFFMHGRLHSVTRHALFTYVPDYLGDGHINFPDAWTVENAETFMKLIRDGSEIRSLRWYVKNLDIKGQRVTHDQCDAKYIDLMTKQRLEAPARYRRGKGLDRDRILFEERTALFNSYVRPVHSRSLWNEYGFKGVDELRKRGEGGPERIASLFKAAMPALELCANMMADLSANPSRKTQRQDFWDFEHAAVAPIYTDAFVTTDKWLRARLQVLRTFKEHRCADPQGAARAV